MRSPSPVNLTMELLLTTKKHPSMNRLSCLAIPYRPSGSNSLTVRTPFFAIPPFDHIQSFFSSSEKPDFKPTIPEFTSEKFYEGE